jgi:hypothetical protein
MACQSLLAATALAVALWAAAAAAQAPDNASYPDWVEYVCGENNVHVVIGNEDYTVNASDGNLMPVRKGQAPPDLRYFKPAPK